MLPISPAYLIRSLASNEALVWTVKGVEELCLPHIGIIRTTT